MTQSPTETNADGWDVPASRERLKLCLADAELWSRELPSYADRTQFKADFWAIAAGILAAFAGLSIFPVVGQNSATWEKAIVSFIALASGISALVPRVKNYGEQAGAARVLAAQYGSVYGRLLDLEKCRTINQPAAKVVLLEFQSIKGKKDELRGLTAWSHKIARGVSLPPADRDATNIMPTSA
jgi:hypothetical protein